MVDYNISQRLGLDLDKHIAIDAGAGTGKTTVMAERYVQHLLAEHQRAKKLLSDGPRSPLQGQGALRAPARERSGMVEWKGLLPNEVVAITFTRKAASELRSRIRARLSQTDIDLYSLTDGDIEMLLTNLEEAPISTIDAFLGRLVTPYLDILSTQPAGEQISEVRSPMLISETINSAWRIRTSIDAQEAGVRGDTEGFIQSRNNLAILLGGQRNAEVVLSGLLNTSLFVEETKRSLKRKAKERGTTWHESEIVDAEIILDMMGSSAESFIGTFANQVRKSLNQWIDVYMEVYANYVHDCEVELGTDKTRFNQLVDLARNTYPEDNIGKLQWVWLVALCSTSKSSLKDKSPKHFPSNKLPKGDGWHAGIHTSNAKVKKLDKKQKSAIAEQAKNFILEMRELLNGEYGRLAKILGQSSYTFDPRVKLNYLPIDSGLNYVDLTSDFTTNPPIGRIRISKELQLEVLKDLLVVHKGCQEILTLRKMQEGVHDFDDIQRLTADLLLARCPDIVRYDYPPEVVDILDDLGDEPWRDEHISRARMVIHKYPKWEEDFERRVSILKTIRKQFLAFIIDEYQDTNPAHFRLLSRLWGHRVDRIDEDNYHGPWDPTICIVGDMKQSIYRFRQAEVTVMRRTVESIKKVNMIEFSTTNFEFRDIEKGRDPRPIGGLDSFNSGGKLYDLPKNIGPWNHIEIFKDDDGVPISDERKERRRLGHIDLTSNHRTAHTLLKTLNGIFEDVFDSRHHSLPGDWHAQAQNLLPKKKDEPYGKLEWLLPLRINNEDMINENNVFSDPNSKTMHLEHEMIALRLQNLIQGKACKIWNPSKREYTELEKPTETIQPNDITILVHTRKNIPDLIERLQSRGIPVISDRQGRLLSQPIVKNLMSALDLVAHPTSKFAAVSFARTPIIGMTDTDIHRVFHDTSESDNWWRVLEDNVGDKKVSNLIQYIRKQIGGQNVHQILNEIIDNSDLLVAHPSDSSRQNAESWCRLTYDIGQECGHNPAEIFAQLQQLEDLGRKGPQATTIPSSGAVRIMTVHGAKGLESKVVVVSGTFKAGQYDSSITSRDNVLVTPEIISGRINPWVSVERPEDGLWQFAKNIDSAQNQAERRREFYVALTRVESHLIIVGNSTNRGELCESSGELKFNSKPSEKTMGHMWLEGLRYLAHRNGVDNSIWLNEGDITGQKLSDYGDKEIIFDPMSLYFNSQLGEGSVKSIAIFDSPGCFVEEKPINPHSKWEMMENLIDNGKTISKKESQINTVSHKLRLGANVLDTSVRCRKHHWPNNLEAWNAKRIAELMNGIGQSEPRTQWYPSPMEFGLMMHRLVEISLNNPGQHIESPVLPLPESWQNNPKNDLTAPESVDIVLAEFGYSTGDKEALDLYYRTKKRMHEIALLVDQGLTGRYAAGETIHDRKAEGLRTELPFLYNHQVDLKDISREIFADCEMKEASKVSNVEIIFEGRADLVMAFSDDEGNGLLQIIDMKTTGCLYGFNSKDPSEGTDLQKMIGNILDRFPNTSPERKILDKYKFQLTLYSIALEAIESEKRVSQRRKIIPPAILIAASGKTIEMTEKEYQDCKQQLAEQLDWIAEISANPTTPENPERMSFEHTMSCWNGEIEHEEVPS